MNKQSFEKAKRLEGELAIISERLKQVEMGKILNLKVRTFNDDKTEFQDVEMTGQSWLPKDKIKGIMRECLLKQKEDKTLLLNSLFTES